MKWVRDWFVNSKIRTKFFLSFAIIIVITVLMISGINYIVSVNLLKRNSSEFSQYLISQIGFNVEKRTADIESIVFQQFRNSTLSIMISQMYNNENAYHDEDYDRNKYIMEYISDLLFLNDYYLSVLIIDANYNKYAVERKSFEKYNDEIMSRIDIDEIRSKHGRATWFRGENDMLFMAKALFDIDSNKYVGIITVGIETSYIEELLNDVRNLMEGDIVILNEDFQMFAKVDDANSATAYFLEHVLSDDLAREQEFEYEGKKFISNVISTDYDKWIIIQIFEVSNITRGTENLKYWIISTLFVSLLLALLLAFLISKHITEGIILLFRGISKFSHDIKHEVIVPKSMDEVGMLTVKFNSMANNINDLFESLYQEKLLKQKAEYRTLQFEYKALQAQMNPHFLYNTLESIRSMAMIKGEDGIAKLIHLLGNILRSSIRKKGDKIKLEEELDYIRDYLAIHQVIYGDRIEVEYEIDEQLIECYVPKFILQPLVENTIVHGIEEKVGKALISIKGFEDKGDLVLIIADNGVGMEQELIQKLLDPIWYEHQAGTSKHTNVGIMSVQKRIRILYGEQYGLHIISAVGEGTSITIRIPIIFEHIE